MCCVVLWYCSKAWNAFEKFVCVITIRNMCLLVEGTVWCFSVEKTFRHKQEEFDSGMGFCRIKETLVRWLQDSTLSTLIQNTTWCLWGRQQLGSRAKWWGAKPSWAGCTHGTYLKRNCVEQRQIKGLKKIRTSVVSLNSYMSTWNIIAGAMVKCILPFVLWSCVWPDLLGQRYLGMFFLYGK